MIEIRVSEDIENASVDRFTHPYPVVWVPHNLSWSDLEVQLSEHLAEHELKVAKKIWCEDDFPRIFKNGDGFVSIRPINS